MPPDDRPPRADRRVRWALAAVLLLGFLVRLWHIAAPIADRHSWNQVSAATVIRHFVRDGIDPFHPQWDVLEGEGTGPRIEAEEAPIYHVVAAALTRLFGGLEVMARLLSIVASLLAAFILYRLAARLTDASTGLFASFFFLLAPFSWFFGRAIMSDMWMLAMLALAVERYECWLRRVRFADLLQAGLAVLLAGLFKPFALHIGLTLIVLQIGARGFRSLFDWRLVVFALLALCLPLAWVAYAAKIGSLGNVVVGEGESALTAERIMGPLSLLWSGAFWMKIQARVLDQMATPIVSILAVLAFVFRRKKFSENSEHNGMTLFYVSLAWLTGAFAYLLLVRDGNQMHNYYQLPFIPPFVLLAAIGTRALSQRIPSQWIMLILLCFSLVSFFYVRTSFALDLSSQRAGELVGEVSRPDDLIVAFDPGSTRKNQVIYAAERRGWHTRSIQENTIEMYRKRGARWLVVCLEEEQIASHPEWLERLADLPKVTETSGDLGPRGEKHFIKVYRLAL